MGTLTAGAAAIAINNSGFETTWPNFSAVPGWTGSGYSDATNPGAGYGNISTTLGTGGDGANYLTLGAGQATNGTISQITSSLVALGDMFTLTIGIGNRGGYSSDDTAAAYVGSIRLLIGGIAVASNQLAGTDTPIAFGFSNATLSYTSTALDAGKTVGVQIGDAGSRLEFDNVRLDAIPEPSSSVMLLGGLGAVLLRRRRVS